jgi:hypothetical protein
MTITITKTRDAAPCGDYVATAVDAAKAAAEFRMVAVVGRKTAIVWRDGRAETVTERRLAQLQAAHRFAADF